MRFKRNMFNNILLSFFKFKNWKYIYLGKNELLPTCWTTAAKRNLCMTKCACAATKSGQRQSNLLTLSTKLGRSQLWQNIMYFNNDITLSRVAFCFCACVTCMHAQHMPVNGQQEQKYEHSRKRYVVLDGIIYIANIFKRTNVLKNRIAEVSVNRCWTF